MTTRKLLGTLVLCTFIFTGCGDEVQPDLGDAVKGSYKVVNGMTMDEVEKMMKIEPTGVEKIGDRIIWKYEGNISKGEEETLQITYNNIVIKFNKGKVSHSGTFSCKLPKITED